MSWGPGIALVWGDGQFVVCGIRDATQVNVHTKDGERFVGVKGHDPPQMDLSASQFTIMGRPQISDVSQTRRGNQRTGKSIRVSLREKESGIAVTWRGIRTMRRKPSLWIFRRYCR